MLQQAASQWFTIEFAAGVPPTAGVLRLAAPPVSGMAGAAARIGDWVYPYVNLTDASGRPATVTTGVQVALSGVDSVIVSQVELQPSGRLGDGVFYSNVTLRSLGVATFWASLGGAPLGQAISIPVTGLAPSAINVTASLASALVVTAGVTATDPVTPDYSRTQLVTDVASIVMPVYDVYGNRYWGTPMAFPAESLCLHSFTCLRGTCNCSVKCSCCKQMPLQAVHRYVVQAPHSLRHPPTHAAGGRALRTPAFGCRCSWCRPACCRRSATW
jgi:hypothetical protein